MPSLGLSTTKAGGIVSSYERDGLVAYYPFNSNSADDKSTNTNNGTVKSGRALAFDGAVDFLTVYDDASLNIGTSDFTVAAWVKLDYSSLPLTDNPGLVRYGGGWNNSNPGFSCLWSTSAVPYLQFSSSSGTSILGTISGASAFTADTWYRTVWVFDRDGNFQLYVNGSASGDAIDISDGSASISPSKNMYIGGVTALPDYPFSGVISDYQFWHSAWSSTDVTNDYNNPEMLAHTFSGTSLTESNLKAWLPMSEGNPESPQTTIFDGANTGLSDELVAVNDLKGYSSIPTGWSTNNTDETHTVTWDSRGARFYSEATSPTMYLNHTAQVVAGRIYKLEVVISNYSGDAGIKIDSAIASSITFTSNGTHTKYITAGDSGQLVSFYRNGSNVDLVIESVSIKPINASNHATSFFYGDEMWDGIQGDDANWSLFGSNTSAEDDGAVKITYIDNSSGGYIKLRDAYDLNDDLVVGRTYIISFSTKVNEGSITWRCQTTGSGDVHDTATAITSTDFESRTMTVVANHSTDMYIHSNGMGTGDIVWVKDLSVKEVGLSTTGHVEGQETIFQPAFVGQNRMHWFVAGGGSPHYINCNDNSTGSALNFIASDFSVSCWVMFNSFSGTAGTSNTYLMSRGTYNTEGWYLNYNTADNKINFYTNQNTGAHDNLLSSAITENIWNHLVITKSGTTATWYINGSADTTGTTADPTTSDEPFRIMARDSSENNVWGSINEIAIFDEALSLAEVQEIYNDGTAYDALTHSKASDLVGYWRNNQLTTAGKWEDLSTNSNDGVVTNSPPVAIFPEGITSGRDINGFFLTHPNKNYLSCDETSYVEISDHSTIRFGTDDFTIECWAKCVDWDYDTSNDTYILSKWEDSNNYWYLRTDSSSLVQFYSKVSGAVKNVCIDDAALTNNTWYHICFTADRNGNGIIYLNGASADTTDISGDSAVNYNNTGSLFIGKYGTTSSVTRFNGQIDDVRLYNKVLTASEVTKNYRHGTARHKE